MDEKNEAILKEVMKRITVYSNENPVSRHMDAIHLATRNNVLYRWAKDGPYYDLRWNQDEPLQRVGEQRLCLTICQRIIDTLPVLREEEPPAPNEPDLESEEGEVADGGPEADAEDVESEAESEEAELEEEGEAEAEESEEDE
jgi:hypothetical protein